MLRYYLFWSIPPLLLFGLSYLTADLPFVSDTVAYAIICVYSLLVLLSIPTSSFFMRRTYDRLEGKPEEERKPALEKVYKIRIMLLNVISMMSAVIYMITCQSNCIYMFLIMTVVILLSYPSRQYVYRQTTKDGETEGNSN
ncbi:MAG: hypothetical protein HUJ96_04710 [Marinilabiliaceae bacterium]|nr:hypothetical protein [Marinilabiliaceae bacterium]